MTLETPVIETMPPRKTVLAMSIRVLAVSDEALREQYAMKVVIRDRLSQMHEALNMLRRVRGQVEGWVARGIRARR